MAWLALPDCRPACATAEKGSGNNTYKSKKGNFINKTMKRNCKKLFLLDFQTLKQTVRQDFLFPEVGTNVNQGKNIFCFLYTCDTNINNAR